MFKKSKIKRTFGPILMTSILVFDSVLQILADVHKIPDLIPNKFLDIPLSKPFSNRDFAIAFALHLLPKYVYKKLEKKYKRRIRKNKRMRKKYRTIVPVSIVPPLAYLLTLQRAKQTEWYVVGPDESKDPQHINIPNEVQPTDPVIEDTLKYQYN